MARAAEPHRPPPRQGRRTVLGGGAAGAALLLAAPALAVRPVALTLLVGARPGSPADRWARGFAPFLERHWPRSSVALRNLPGEGGLAAARALAETVPADGRTFGVVSTPALIARCIERAEEALLARLDLVAAVAEEPVVLVAGAAGAASGDAAAELAALRAPEAHGRLLGTPPPGGAAELAAAMLSAGALPLQRLAFPNAAAARSAAIAGNVAAALLPLPDAMAALREGRLLGIAIARAHRHASLAEVPTFAEAGLPPLRLANHRGLAAPRGTPEERLAALAAALGALVADPEFVAQAEADGYEPRLLPNARWAAAIAELTATLRRRWDQEPWTAREG
ncbi:tripartite tricarboxylate transporter substrate-binding protein [Caldovatus aquaticus]|uniref:Tripartite tricarboxylate transporter substrate binding protein n=1 Tax=Caldovatus aquaticus TaxID=2865671 RepID=A0ABS7EZ52_9PROT|nr:tripartite tricarboxylate transporter substrate-binding protein [Caldovatus aquaticus]MBW8268647.1 hypothetical protein [Caldovatus aquaticus]